MRRKIVAGNWKMNLNADEARDLFAQFVTIAPAPKVEMYVFAPSLYLDRLITGYPSVVKVGAQNAWYEDRGAMTGEISMWQLSELGVKAVLIGHSERRMYFNEDNALLRKKVDAALLNGLEPFFCCGETREIRESGNYLDFIRTQLEESVFHLDRNAFCKIVIAYEPVWAIGTGLTATSGQAEEVHAAIRSWIEQQYDAETATNTVILYGGSCNPGNAQSLFACENIDGGLIGGASLKLDDFSKLVSEEVWTI